MSLQKNISEHVLKLTEMEKELLNELLLHRESFAYETFTVMYMAEFFNVSKTSAHRLTQKLGYQNFTHFKDAYFLKDPTTTETIPPNQDSYTEMLLHSYNAVKNSDLSEIVAKMVAAQKITIYGMGMSNFLGKIFQIKLQLIGKQTEQFDDSRFMRVSARYLDASKDILFVLSRSGRPPELIEAVVEANLKKIPIVLITEVADSPLAQLATYVIQTAHATDTDSDMDTRLNAHIAMDVIITEYIAWAKKTNID